MYSSTVWATLYRFSRAAHSQIGVHSVHSAAFTLEAHATTVALVNHDDQALIPKATDEHLRSV
jgi:hypothetical protein